MGLSFSSRLRETDFNYYNHLEYENIPIQICRTINSEVFVAFIKDKWTVKKILCRSFGYKIKENADIDEILSKFNSYINEADRNFNAKIHGIDNQGYVLVTLKYKYNSDSVNLRMLELEGIDSFIHYDHDNNKFSI